MWLIKSGVGRKIFLPASLLVCSFVTTCTPRAAAPTVRTPSTAMSARPALIPLPVSVALNDGERFGLGKDLVIEVTANQPQLERIGQDLARLLRPALDVAVPVRPSAATPSQNAIRLEIANDNTGEEGYELVITPTGASIKAATAAGVFYGVQTFRQLLPWSVELRGARPHALSVPTGRIADRPRFAWRGAMLDVARHFFPPRDVKRYIDFLAYYKFNHFHLHLSDDQGWRVEIASWPNLTAHGSTTAVGGDPGGFYSKKEYADLVAYAAERFITIVPEIDMPSHINAALASYAELNCDGKAPPLYTGIEVGFSSFCIDKDITYKFIDDVVREIAAMTPGPYFHIGGDEVKTLTPAQYKQFVERVQPIVERHGKQVIGWDEIAHATLLPNTVVQYWRPDASIKTPPSTKLVLSPANKVYLDMKYDDTTVLGLNWAGNVDVSVPYEWDPATHLPAVQENAILGVETAIWSETLATMRDLEFLAFPRLAAVAEMAWSPQSARQWSEFRVRLGAQAPRWQALGINAYWSPKIDWLRP
jgi:hexosaminidase